MSYQRSTLPDVLAEALFVSGVPTHSNPTRGQVVDAIRRTLRQWRGSRGCAAEMAFRYGENPECAATRMRWARRTVRVAYRGEKPWAGPTRARRRSAAGRPVELPLAG